jgi:hypothetical protein
MSRFASPFDGNPIQTYLHVAPDARPGQQAGIFFPLPPARVRGDTTFQG